MKQYFKITGSARALPEKRITAEELDERGGLPKGWTYQRTGVRYRYEVVQPADGRLLGCRVIREALASAGMGIADMELLIDGSLSVIQPIPCNSALLQEALGPEARGCATLDIQASCLGFVAALQVANGLFAAGAYHRAVIVCTETPLRAVNWKQPESSHLMGDGAAAVVVEACDPVHDCTFAFQTFGDGAQLCRVTGGGHFQLPHDYSPENHANYVFHMDGESVHKFASKHLPPLVRDVLERAGTSMDQLHVVPHQASGPAIKLMARRLKIPPGRLHASIEEHGNIIAAGIPYVLHAVRNQLAAGTRIMLIGTAAGYSQAVAIFTL